MKEVFCIERTGQGNEFELNLTAKMETRDPVEGSFTGAFLSISNCFRVMVICSCKKCGKNC